MRREGSRDIRRASSGLSSLELPPVIIVPPPDPEPEPSEGDGSGILQNMIGVTP